MGLEFEKEYDIIDSYCKKSGIEWFASPWDLDSFDFLITDKIYENSIALITAVPLVEKIAKNNSYHTFISTGMSTMTEIENVVNIFKKNKNKNFELMHCNSTYPCNNNEVNLNLIDVLRKRFNCKVGYSGHEEGLQISIAAAALGATSIGGMLL